MPSVPKGLWAWVSLDWQLCFPGSRGGLWLSFAPVRPSLTPGSGGLLGVLFSDSALPGPCSMFSCYPDAFPSPLPTSLPSLLPLLSLTFCVPDSASTFCPLFSPCLHPYLTANHQMPFGYSPQNISGLLYTLGLQTHVPSAIHSAWYSEYQQRVVEFMSLVFFFLHAVICVWGGVARVPQCVRGVCLITSGSWSSPSTTGIGSEESAGYQHAPWLAEPSHQPAINLALSPGIAITCH